MLDRRRRAEAISRGAAPFLEPGETVVHVVQVGAGHAKGSADIVVGGVPGTVYSSRPLKFYGLIATERNVYALRLGGKHHREPEAVLLKWPVAQVSMRRNGNKIYMREDEETPERGFEVSSLFGKRAKSLVAYVSRQSPGRS